MPRIQSIPALLAVVTLFSCSNASAQLFRRDEPAADKAKQQQQQRTQTDPKQKTATPTNRSAMTDRNSLNNQANRTGQTDRNISANRNNSSAQLNRPFAQNNSPPTNAGLNGRFQAAPPARPGAASPSVRQQPVTQNNRGINQQPSVPQSPRGNGQTQYAQPNTNAPSPSAHSQAAQSQAANLRHSMTRNNPFATAPLAQPGFAAPLANQSTSGSLSGTTNDTSLLVGKPGVSLAESNAESSTNNSVSEADIVERFGVHLNPNGDDIVIAQVKPKGSAAAAGLRTDDKLTSIGGAVVSNRAEFYEIARLLSLGDQIEIEFERAGKAEKSVIQYGASPTSNPSIQGGISLNPDTIQIDSNQLSSDSGWAPTTDDRTARLEQQVIKQQLIIQELQERIKQLESEQIKKF